MHFQNTDLNNICASVVFQAKTKEKYEEHFFNALFQGSTNFFFFNFFPVLAFKTTDAQMLLMSVFENAKKSYLPPKKAKRAFLTSKIIPDL